MAGRPLRRVISNACNLHDNTGNGVGDVLDALDNITGESSGSELGHDSVHVVVHVGNHVVDSERGCDDIVHHNELFVSDNGVDSLSLGDLVALDNLLTIGSQDTAARHDIDSLSELFLRSTCTVEDQVFGSHLDVVTSGHDVLELSSDLVGCVGQSDNLGVDEVVGIGVGQNLVADANIRDELDAIGSLHGLRSGEARGG